MKKSFKIVFLFLVSFFSLIFVSCSVDEDESGRLKALSIYIPSAKAMVSTPSNDTELLALEYGSEWYAYTSLEILSSDGRTQEVKDFKFDEPISVVVTEGVCEIKAYVIIGKYADDDDIRVSTYHGRTFSKIEAGSDIVPISLSISPIYSESLSLVEYFPFDSTFDPEKYLPGDVIIEYYSSLPPSASPVDGDWDFYWKSETLKDVIRPEISFDMLQQFMGKTFTWVDTYDGNGSWTIGEIRDAGGFVYLDGAEYVPDYIYITEDSPARCPTKKGRTVVFKITMTHAI